MPFLRFLMFLSLIVWIGGIIFFSAGVAPVAFGVLPSRHLAGTVVSRSLTTLHWMGLISGLVFLATSLLHSRLAGNFQLFTGRNLLLCLMLALTLVSQFGVTPKLAAIRASVGEIDSVPADNPVRLQFNCLHAWSTRLEVAVLLMGLVVVYMTATLGS